MYINRDELMKVLIGVLEDELPEKNKKEREAIADAVTDGLDGPILTVVDEDDSEDDDSEDDSEDEPYEMD